MDYLTDFLIALSVMAVTLQAFSLRRARKLIAELRRHEAADAHLTAYLTTKLTNLRANAYLTNEHGHRVRYHKASAEVRARAEAGE